MKPVFTFLEERQSVTQRFLELPQTTPPDAPPLLTVGRHGPNVWPVHDALVLLSQRLDVALAEIQDLLPQHSAVLVAGSLLDGEV